VSAGAAVRLSGGRPALIWINFGAVVFGYVFRSFLLFPDRKLTSRPHPSIRHCPVCGIAMQASKSREDLAHFDIFECLSCQTQIRETKPRPAPGDTNVP
jgi:hypothetical protein